MEVIVKGQPSIEIGFETKVIQVGGLGDIDSSLSTESENPVMNKVITAELNNKADKGEVTAALNTKADKNETDTKLATLSEEINGNSVEITDFSAFERFGLQLVNGNWVAAGNESIVIPIENNRECRIVGTSNRDWYFSLLKSANNLASGAKADICTLGEIAGGSLVSSKDKYIVAANAEVVFTTPADCQYITITTRLSDTDCTPKSLYVDGVKGLIQQFEDLKVEVATEIDTKIAHLIDFDLEVTTEEGKSYVSMNLDKPLAKGSIISSFNGYNGKVSFQKRENGQLVPMSGAVNRTESMLPITLPDECVNISMSIGGKMTISIITKATYAFTNDVVYADDISALMGITKKVSGKIFPHYVATDLHGNWRSLEVLKTLRKYDSTTPILSMGDELELTPKLNGEVNAEVEQYISKAIELGIYHCVGQHECGFTSAGLTGATNKAEMFTHDEVFQYFIEPMKEKWGLPNLDKNYYYKDFDSEKVRLISLYQFNTPLIDDTSKAGHILYKRDNIWYGTEQLSWLIETLNSTPDGYTIVIMQHTPTEEIVYNAFDTGLYYNGASDSTNRICEGTPIMDIVNAYIGRTTINKAYNAIDIETYPTSVFTQEANGNFANAKGRFAFFIFGDNHGDAYGKTRESKLNAICVTSSGSPHDYQLGKVGKTDTIITAHSLREVYSKLWLCVGRLGQQISVWGGNNRSATLKLDD